MALLATAGGLTGCGGGSASNVGYTVGGTVSGLAGTALVLQNSDGAEVTVASNGSFVFPSSMASGSTYTVTTKALPAVPAQNCVVTNAAGRVTSTNVSNISVSCAKFAYAINMYSNDIWAYSIDSATRALTPVAGSAFATGGAYPTVYPTGVAIDPSGKFAYVANATNGGSNTIAGFAIDPGTGALSPLAGSPFAAGSYTYSVAVHPSGQFLFVGSNDVSVYAIDPKAGSLTPVAGSPFTSIGDVGGTYTFGFADPAWNGRGETLPTILITNSVVQFTLPAHCRKVQHAVRAAA